MSLVSVIIANRNKRQYLERCLQSVLNQTYGSIEVIVIDNGSLDDSVQMVRDKFSGVRLISNQNNRLYSQAQNMGIRQARGEYIICLNNDAILEKDFVERMVQAANFDEKIGMVCGKIMSWGKDRIDSGGQLLGRSRKPVERGYKQKDKGRFNKPCYIFSAGGVAPLYKRKMLEEIKINGEYFDESYGMFYEDLDLAWRANRFGWKAFYNPKALAYHLRGGTAKTIIPGIGFLKKYDFTYLTPELKASLVKNRYLTILKNDSIKDFLCNFPYIISYEFRLWTYIVFLQPGLIPKIARTLFHIKAAYQKRKEIFQRLSNEKKRL